MPLLRDGFSRCGMSVWNCVFERTVNGRANAESSVRGFGARLQRPLLAPPALGLMGRCG